MTKATTSPVDVALRRLFAEQARSVAPLPRSIGEASLLRDAGRPHSRRILIAALLTLCAVVSWAVGAMVTTGNDSASDGVSALRNLPRNAVHWSTQQVTLEADVVTIDVGGDRFTAPADALVDSDRGDTRYQTLEIAWMEHGVAMRWYIYFTSDGREWWSNEMRTYDGQNDGEWVTFGGTYFRRPIGSPFVGDLDIRATNDQGITSRLYVRGLRLEAFRS